MNHHIFPDPCALDQLVPLLFKGNASDSMLISYKEDKLNGHSLVLTGELHGEDWPGPPAELLLHRGSGSLAAGMDGFSS